MKKPALIWDVWNRKHIKKHSVSEKEAEEAYEHEFGRSDTYHDRQAIYGKTQKGRLITIVASYKKQSRPYVVSARDMSRKERRLYYEEKNI